MTATTAEKTSKKASTASTTSAPGGEEPPKDLEIILPPSGELEIQGVRCGVRRLRMREFFGLMGIITNGLGPGLQNVNWAGASDADELGATMMATFIMAVPNQIPQFIVFVQDIVEPLGSKQENRMVRDYLDNPEIEDMLPIVDMIIDQEKDHVFDLVGKARAYLTRWQETFSR